VKRKGEGERGREVSESAKGKKNSKPKTTAPPTKRPTRKELTRTRRSCVPPTGQGSCACEVGCEEEKEKEEEEEEEREKRVN
jgi:hypothetical protein